MKPVQKWHFTPVGKAALFLGSIELAVPVMVMVAIAMAWGTYLESKHGVETSRATVYGSWWFIVLMGLICVSLVFAVITRYPWKRKHVGFITVHTGLVMLIVGGFWSLFGRIEGHMALQEGSSSHQLETDKELLSVTEFKNANAKPLAEATAPHSPASLTLAGANIQVVEFWENSSEEEYLANDSQKPFRAVEVTFEKDAKSGQWVGDESQSGGPPTINGMIVRVLPDGADWSPPTAPAGSDYYFTVGTAQYPLKAVGEEAFPGWKVISLQRFVRATVSDGKLADTGPQDNPAVEVTISNGAGSTERHTCFRNFPDMVMSRLIEGTAKSGAGLAATPASKQPEVLVVFGTVATPRIGYVDSRGAGRELTAPASIPATLEVGQRRLTILNQYANARVATRIVKAPTASNRRPALLIRLPNTPEPVPIAWKGFAQLPDSTGRNLLLTYGPRMVELPFTIQLKDFRKTDYPGTEMAMAYESEVSIKEPDQSDKPFVIHMNSPYASYPWKVYQSGFSGEAISIFSVMRDPGLKMTYLGSAVLCLGIFLTFFSRSFSWGHPGIPAPHIEKEAADAPTTQIPAIPAPGAAAKHPEPTLAGSGA